MRCPRCNGELRHEAYEGVEIDRCGKCRGTWLDEGELIRIVTVKEEVFSPELLERAIDTAFAGVPQSEAHSPVKCPKCAREMRAVNYSYNSGIVMDRCPGSHGVWLDGEELEKIQAHAERWEQEAAESRLEWVSLIKSVQEDRSGPKSVRYIVSSVLKKFLG